MIDVDFLFAEIKAVPVELALVAVFLLGAFSGLLAAFAWVLHYRKQVNKAQLELKRAGL